MRTTPNPCHFCLGKPDADYSTACVGHEAIASADMAKHHAEQMVKLLVEALAAGVGSEEFRQAMRKIRYEHIDELAEHVYVAFHLGNVAADRNGRTRRAA